MVIGSSKHAYKSYPAASLEPLFGIMAESLSFLILTVFLLNTSSHISNVFSLLSNIKLHISIVLEQSLYISNIAFSCLLLLSTAYTADTIPTVTPINPMTIKNIPVLILIYPFLFSFFHYFL